MQRKIGRIAESGESQSTGATWRTACVCVCVCAFATIESGPKRQTTKRTNRKNNMHIDTTKSHGPWLGTKPTKRTAKQTFKRTELRRQMCIVLLPDRFHSRTRETPVSKQSGREALVFRTPREKKIAKTPESPKNKVCGFCYLTVLQKMRAAAWPAFAAVALLAASFRRIYRIPCAGDALWLVC